MRIFPKTKDAVEPAPAKVYKKVPVYVTSAFVSIASRILGYARINRATYGFGNALHEPTDFPILRFLPTR